MFGFSAHRIFIGTKATGANVFVGFLAVDLDADLMHVGAERTLRVAVGVADVVAAHFAFSANNANSAHSI